MDDQAAMLERLRVFSDKHPPQAFRGLGKTCMMMAKLEEAITGIPLPEGPFLVQVEPKPKES